MLQLAKVAYTKFMGGYVYLFVSIVMSTYIQIVLKWQLIKYTSFPSSLMGKLLFLLSVIFTNFYIFSVFIAACISFIAWLLAVRLFPVSVIYPMMSVCYVTVALCSRIFFKETVSLVQSIGMCSIIIGSILVNK